MGDNGQGGHSLGRVTIGSPCLQCARLPSVQPTTMSPPKDTLSHLCLVSAAPCGLPGRGSLREEKGRWEPKKGELGCLGAGAPRGGQVWCPWVVLG